MKFEKKFKYTITNDEYDALEATLNLLEEIKDKCAEDVVTTLNENIPDCEFLYALTYAPKESLEQIISILSGIKNCAEDPNEI